MKAWLVTWEWAGDHAAVADKVAAILSPRWSAERVSGIVEVLYAKRNSTASELAAYAGRPARNPYRAQCGFGSPISCGHNPWLEARLVDDLTVVEDPVTKIETITWVEPPRYALGRHGLQRVRGCLRRSVVRRVRGPLSDDLIRDATSGT